MHALGLAMNILLLIPVDPTFIVICLDFLQETQISNVQHPDFRQNFCIRTVSGMYISQSQ